MNKYARLVLNFLPAVLIVAGVSIAARAFAGKSVPPVVSEMVNDIRDSQRFVMDTQPKVDAAKQKAQVYRSAICSTYKDYCSKEYLDPMDAGVDLSGFLAPAAK